MDNETKQMFEIILKKLDSMEASQTEMKVDMTEMKANMTEMKNSQNRIEEKVNTIYDHTARLTEDITEINMKLDEVIDDIDFLKHKEHKTEEDLFKLTKNLKLVK